MAEDKVPSDITDEIQAYIQRSQADQTKHITSKKFSEVENPLIVANEKKVTKMCANCKNPAHEGECKAWWDV